MLFLYLATGAGLFILAIYLYASAIAKSGRKGSTNPIPYRGRDMWRASLLDCDYEPAKYVFGPGKAIPAEASLTRLSSDTPFYVHKENE